MEELHLAETSKNAPPSPEHIVQRRKYFEEQNNNTTSNVEESAATSLFRMKSSPFDDIFVQEEQSEQSG